MKLRTAIPLLMVLTTGSVLHAQTYYGPTPYLQRSDSPFLAETNHLYLEDCEDGTFDAPGVTHNALWLAGPANNTDSVDADDGVIDGYGQQGWSMFASPGTTGITFVFDPNVLGRFPTHAGGVWTDGADDVYFEAWDENGVSLGAIGPFDHPDLTFNGTTVDDRFYGASNPGGISKIRFTNTSGGIEVDHFQFEFTGINLSASDNSVSAGDPLQLTTTQGIPGKLVLLIVLDVNGTLLFQHVATSTFDGAGEWTLGATVPPGLSGLDIGMVTLGASTLTGKFAMSNRVEVEFL